MKTKLKYKGYINYFIDGVLKTWNFESTTIAKVDERMLQIKANHKFVGMKINIEEQTF